MIDSNARGPIINEACHSLGSRLGQNSSRRQIGHKIVVIDEVSDMVKRRDLLDWVIAGRRGYRGNDGNAGVTGTGLELDVSEEGQARSGLMRITPKSQI